MKLKKYKKYIFIALIFVITVGLTFTTIFSNNSIHDIIDNLSKLNFSYGIICVMLSCGYFILQGWYTKRNMALMDNHISVVKGIYYTMVEFFFSGITPSSTGGQPLQLYFMHKDNIPKKVALITLLINTIYFKIIIFILGILALIFANDIILHTSPALLLFYIIGMCVELVIIVGGYLLLYKPNILKSLMEFTEKVIRKFKKNFKMKIDESVELYSQEVKVMSSNKLELFYELVITLFQRLCFFSMPYVIYRAFGLNSYNYFQMILIQSIIQVVIDCVPLPGGTGTSEYLFSVLFVIAFGETLTPTAMLLTRFFIFYIPLIICGITTLCKYLIDNCIKRNESSV